MVDDVVLQFWQDVREHCKLSCVHLFVVLSLAPSQGHLDKDTLLLFCATFHAEGHFYLVGSAEKSLQGVEGGRHLQNIHRLDRKVILEKPIRHDVLHPGSIEGIKSGWGEGRVLLVGHDGRRGEKRTEQYSCRSENRSVSPLP